jgi:hypothetical protein
LKGYYFFKRERLLLVAEFRNWNRLPSGPFSNAHLGPTYVGCEAKIF